MDEAAVALNLMDAGSWAEVLRPGHLQAAPALFLLFEKASLDLFGPSELALRLLPLLASIAALFLFARLARQILEPLPAALATGVLAVSYFPVRFAAEDKPYATDLCVAVVLLILTVNWLEDGSRLRPLALLLAAAPVAVAVSYPAVFVLAARGELERAQPPFVLAEHEVLALKRGPDREPPVPCSVSLWKRPAAPG